MRSLLTKKPAENERGGLSICAGFFDRLGGMFELEGKFAVGVRSSGGRVACGDT